MNELLDPQAVNSYDVFTRDCLTYAVQYDQLEIMKYLLKNGADVNNVATGLRNNFLFLIESYSN
jgi:hypothetical protein